MMGRSGGDTRSLLWKGQENLPELFSWVSPAERKLSFGRGVTNTVLFRVLVKAHCSWGEKTGKKISTLGEGEDCKLDSGLWIHERTGSLTRPSLPEPAKRKGGERERAFGGRAEDAE